VDWLDRGNLRCKLSERTREELIESLRLTLKEALEFNRKDAIAAIGPGFIEETIAV
jgi:hypothetical protein